MTQLYTAGGMGPRRNSFSGFDSLDKASLQMKDDIFLANLMASLNPEPWELRKRLRSHVPVNHLKQRVKKRLNNTAMKLFDTGEQ